MNQDLLSLGHWMIKGIWTQREGWGRLMSECHPPGPCGSQPGATPYHLHTPPPSCPHPYFVLLSFQLASQTLIPPDFSKHLFLHFVCLLSHHRFLLDLSALNILMVLTSCILPFPLVSGAADPMLASFLPFHFFVHIPCPFP